MLAIKIGACLISAHDLSLRLRLVSRRFIEQPIRKRVAVTCHNSSCAVNGVQDVRPMYMYVGLYFYSLYIGGWQDFYPKDIYPQDLCPQDFCPLDICPPPDIYPEDFCPRGPLPRGHLPPRWCLLCVSDYNKFIMYPHRRGIRFVFDLGSEFFLFLSRPFRTLC